MNILKHKSWHVYNEKNRERVRRDEQQLAEEEEKERERALLAEKERRLAALRAKSRSGDGAVETREDLDVAAATSGTSIYSGKHINFWASLETEVGVLRWPVGCRVLFLLVPSWCLTFPSQAGNGKIVNEEREEEKRKEKEAADRKTTSYLSRGKRLRGGLSLDPHSDSRRALRTRAMVLKTERNEERRVSVIIKETSCRPRGSQTHNGPRARSRSGGTQRRLRDKVFFLVQVKRK